MKQIAITLLAGIICIMSAIAYDTVYQLVQKNRELQLQVDSYKIMIQQQERKALGSEIQLRKRIRKLNEAFTMCVNSKPIVINRLQYRCYQVYDI